jgi:hypothetical protein
LDKKPLIPRKTKYRSWLTRRRKREEKTKKREREKEGGNKKRGSKTKKHKGSPIPQPRKSAVLGTEVREKQPNR